MSARTIRGAGATGSWDPLNELMVLKDRMNRLFENVLLRGGDLGEKEIAGWSPAIDVREDREGFVVTAEIPGVPRDSLAIRVEGLTLFVEGERPLGEQSRAVEHLRVERFYGPFSRAISLTAAIDEEKVTARFRLGVLEIFLPKSTRGKAGSVKIPLT